MSDIPYSVRDKSTRVNAIKGLNFDSIYPNELFKKQDANNVTGANLFSTSSASDNKLQLRTESGVLSTIVGTIKGETSGLLTKLHLNTSDIDEKGITITSQGRVGIGVTDPEEDLEIDGNIQLDTGGVQRGRVIFYDKQDDHEHAEIDALGEGANGGVLVFYTKGVGGPVTEKMRINNVGNVGIGTNNPTSKLEVNGDFLVSGGTVTLPAATAIGNVSSTEIGYLDGVTSAIQTQLNTKAPTDYPTFTGVVQMNGISVNITSFLNISTGTYFRTGGFEMFREFDPNGFLKRWNMSVNSNGRLNIYQPDHGNGVYIDNLSSSGWVNFSDERLKADIRLLDDCLSKVLQIRPVSYVMKARENGVRSVGFIAQDWQKVQPEVVSYTSTDSIPDLLGLSYTSTIPVLLGAVQELHTKVTTLETTVARLENQRTENESLLTDIVARLRALEEV